MGGMQVARTTGIVKGTRLTQADPSRVSSSKAGGTSGRTAAGGTGQWTNSSVCQTMRMTGRPDACDGESGGDAVIGCSLPRPDLLHYYALWRFGWA